MRRVESEAAGVGCLSWEGRDQFSRRAGDDDEDGHGYPPSFFSFAQAFAMPSSVMRMVWRLRNSTASRQSSVSG